MIVESTRKTLEDLESKRLVIRRRCVGDAAQIWVRRTHLVNDFLEQLDFVDKLIYVKYEGEKGADGGGLTRAVFPDFWDAFLKMYGKGKGSCQHLSMTPQSRISPKHLEAAGRVLILGFILNGYLPCLNHAQLYFLLARDKPSTVFIQKTFLNCLDISSQRNILKALESDVFDEELRMTLIAFFSCYETSSLPCPATIKTALEEAAEFALITKPFYMLHHMREGITNSPFIGLSEEAFEALMATLRPSGSDIVANLNLIHSGNPEYYGLEERVGGYLENFLFTLTQEQAAIFMRFVSGDEKVKKVNVEFNGALLEERMIPTANTCSVSLHLSRWIMSDEQLDKLFSFLFIYQQEHWNSFSVV